MRAEFSLDYDVLTVERPQKVYLMARFIAGEHPTHEKRRRLLNLSLVLDRSGSMAGDKMDYTKQAAQFLVQHLSNQDRLSIVLYNDQVETLLPAEVITNKDLVNQLIDKIMTRGTTNLSGGWLEGCRHVKSELDEDRLNRVILMSDGLANRGVTDTETLIQLAQQKRAEGVSTTTMGLGSDFNEDLMMQMANAGGGAFYFIESPEVAPLIFQEELSGLLNVIGQNLRIEFDATQHVANVLQLNAYPMTRQNGRSIFQLGDMFANEVKTLVLELTIPALHQIGKQQIATLYFTYDEVTKDSTTHHEEALPVYVNVEQEGRSLLPPNPEVSNKVMLLRAARARQEAVKAADRGDYQSATAVLRDMAAAIKAAEGGPNEELEEERSALLAQADLMEEGASRYDPYSRKTMSTQAFYTMNSRHEDTIMLRQRENQRSKHDTMEEPIPAVDPDSTALIPREPGVVPEVILWKQSAFELVGDVIGIGRSSHNEITIDERGVSRFHSKIVREEGQLVLHDLDSTNGTLINGERLVGKHVLSVGDVVYLCDEKLVFGKRSE